MQNEIGITFTVIISGWCIVQRLQWDSIWLEWEANWWRFSLWYQLYPSTQPVLWEICLKYCIFWRKQIDPFALRVFVNLINGMRNSLWNVSFAFEFHVHFCFCQSFHAAFELPFTSLSHHHTFPRHSSQFQEPECPACCPSKYVKSDLFSTNEEWIWYNE